MTGRTLATLVVCAAGLAFVALSQSACSDDPTSASSAAGTGGAGAAGAMSAGSGGAGAGGAGGAGGTEGTSGAGGMAGSAGTSGAAGQGTSGTTGTAGTAGAAGGPWTGPHTCDAPRFGSPMVEIPSPSGVSYCVDVREVTQSEYRTFLDTKKGDVSGQSSRCSSINDSFEIPVQAPGGDTDTGKCPSVVYDPDAWPTQPVRCMDVCDAEAFCKWAGKRLCGGIGKTITPQDVVAGVQGEWANACSEGGKHAYPGSDEPQSTCSNGNCAHLQTSEPYSSLERLGGGFGEFLDICGPPWSSQQPAFPEFCIVAGGMINGTYAACSLPDYWASTQFYSTTIGIRCCAE